MKDATSLRISSIASFIAADRPYLVKWSDVGIFLEANSTGPVAPSQILYAFNAALVGLCITTEPLPVSHVRWMYYHNHSESIEELAATMQSNGLMS